MDKQINIVANHNFDLCRITHSKQLVDISHNTIRAYAREGLNLYKLGRSLFFSKKELEDFIRRRAKVVHFDDGFENEEEVE